MDPSPYGLNCHILNDMGMELVAAAGIRWTRIDVDWAAIEPTKGERKWEDVAGMLAATERLGLQALAVVAYTPPWAGRMGGRSSPPRDPEDYLRFLEDFLAYFGQRIAAMSVWNEPNLPEFWAGRRDSFLREIWIPGLELAEGVAPGVLRIGPDLSSAGNNRCLKDGWFQEAVGSAASHLNAISHHQYDGGDKVDGRVRELKRVRAAMERAGAAHLALWCTEIGWSRGQVDQQRQAALLTETMRKVPAVAEKVFWYDSHGPDWGILTTETNDPLQAYDAYKAVIAEG